jgi:hypothetical protein
MASSLVLTGVKDIKKNTGTEMLRLNPKRGGDTFKLKRWWVVGGNGTVYTNTTVINVTTAAGTVKLAIESSLESKIRIAHDGSFGFTFSDSIGVSRAALFNDSFELIEHYVFPSISGGKIMTVTPSGGADRPTAAPVNFSEQTVMTGTAQAGEVLTAVVGTFTGGVGTVSTNLIFQSSANGTSGWNFLNGNPDTASHATVTYTIPASEVGNFIRASYQVTDDNGTTSSNSPATVEVIAA